MNRLNTIEDLLDCVDLIKRDMAKPGASSTEFIEHVDTLLRLYTSLEFELRLMLQEQKERKAS
jgi:hypothetical protein